MREEIKKFAEDMERVMSEHDDEKDDSWKQCKGKYLGERLKEEFEEYRETADKEELIDIANYCMMLYLRSSPPPSHHESCDGRRIVKEGE